MTVDYTLYLATDHGLLGDRDVRQVVAVAIENGVSVVQLREKGESTRAFHEAGVAILSVTRHYGVPLIINDRVDIMLALDADGVHIGRDDLPLATVRALAPDKIIGYSVNQPEHLATAVANGADYVGFGPVFSTTTKVDASAPLGLDGLRELALDCPIPCVAIGGIQVENAASVVACGVSGCCVISAILGAPDVGSACQDLRRTIESVRRRDRSDGACRT